MSEDADIVRADTKLRKLALVGIAAAAVVGSLTTGWLLPALLSALAGAKARGTISVRTVCLLFLAAITLLGGLVIAFGRYLMMFGLRVARDAQYPPPGARVLRDTRVVRGGRAVNLGNTQRFLGGVLILCGLALIVLSFYAVAVILT